MQQGWGCPGLIRLWRSSVQGLRERTECISPPSRLCCYPALLTSEECISTLYGVQEWHDKKRTCTPAQGIAVCHRLFRKLPIHILYSRFRMHASHSRRKHSLHGFMSLHRHTQNEWRFTVVLCPESLPVNVVLPRLVLSLFSLSLFLFGHQLPEN